MVNKIFFLEILKNKKNLEQLLYAAGPNTFLVRRSSQPGCYALSIHMQDSFIHWILAPNGTNYFIQNCNEDKNEYPSMIDLVAKTPILSGYYASGSGIKRDELFNTL